MIMVGQSDLASMMNRSGQTATTKAELAVASMELSSARKNNLLSASAGDLGQLFAIDRSISELDVQTNAIHLASGKAALTQKALGNIYENLVDFGPQLLSAVERGDAQSFTLISRDARLALGAVTTSLNARYGRHSVFSGADVDATAIASADAIISDISTIVAGVPDSAAALTAIDEYFYSPGGGFENNAFLGGVADAPSLHHESGEMIAYAQRADSQEIRGTIRALVIAVVASDAPNFVGTPDQVDLLREAGTAAIAATGDITRVRETLGFAEGRIEAAQARTRAMSDVFSLERAAIVSADPFEAATRFEALQTQLQTIYTVTSRLSKLSLTNFLR